MDIRSMASALANSGWVAATVVSCIVCALLVAFVLIDRRNVERLNREPKFISPYLVSRSELVDAKSQIEVQRLNIKKLQRVLKHELAKNAALLGIIDGLGESENPEVRRIVGGEIKISVSSSFVESVRIGTNFLADSPYCVVKSRLGDSFSINVGAQDSQVQLGDRVIVANIVIPRTLMEEGDADA